MDLESREYVEVTFLITITPVPVQCCTKFVASKGEILYGTKRKKLLLKFYVLALTLFNIFHTHFICKYFAYMHTYHILKIMVNVLTALYIGIMIEIK